MPRSTIAPRASMMISSQSRIVLRRCAMMMQVQPRRRRLSSMDFSVIGSMRRSLRQDEDRGIGNQRPGDFDALALTAAEIGAAFIDIAVVISGPRRDVFVNRRVLRPRQVGFVAVASHSVKLSRAVPSNIKTSWST